MSLRTMHGDEVTVTLVAEYLSGSRGGLEHDSDSVYGSATLYSDDGAVSFTSDDGPGVLFQVYGEEGTVVGHARIGVTLYDISEGKQS